MRARCDVVAGHVAISVHPLIDAECGVAVELLDFVCLYFREITEDWLRTRGAICAHLKCECESAAHIVVVVVELCAGMADRWCLTFIMEAPKVIRLCVYTQSESENTVQYCTLPRCQGEISSVHFQNGRNKGGGEGCPYDYHLRPQRRTKKGRGADARRDDDAHSAYCCLPRPV